MSTPGGDASPCPTPDQKRLIWACLTVLALAALAAVGGVAFVGLLELLSWSYPIILPLGLAVLVALIFKPAVDFLETRGLSRTPITLAVCALIVGGFVVFWAFILPPVYNQTVGFLHDMPQKFNDATTQLLQETAGMSGVHAWLKTNLPAFQRDIPQYAAAAASRVLAPVGSAFGFILGFGFVPIYVFYFIADEHHFAQHWQEFVPFRPGRARDEAIAVLSEFSQLLVSYLRGQIIVSAVDGVLTFIGLAIIGVPYSLVLGLITGALSIVPFLGIIVSILPALILAYLSGQTPTWMWLGPLLVLVVFALVQMIESSFVSPRVQAHSTGLHPLVIILGILIWSMLLPGLLGPIVAVPLTCAVVVLLRRYVWLDVPQRRRKGQKIKVKSQDAFAAS